MFDKTLELGHLSRHLNIVTRDNDIFNDLIDSQWRGKVVKEENVEGMAQKLRQYTHYIYSIHVIWI